MTPQLPAAVLWDMDGTLADTEPCWIRAQSAVLERRGLPSLTREQELELVGASSEVVVALMHRLGVTDNFHEIIAEVFADVVAQVQRGIAFRPGAVALLCELNERGVPTALVTNSNRALTDAVLTQLTDARLTVTVTNEDVRPGKPDPAPYAHAAGLLDVNPRDCLVIEDSLNGIRSGLAAGCAVLAVPHGMPLEASPNYALRATLEGVDWHALSEIYGEHRADAGAGE